MASSLARRSATSLFWEGPGDDDNAMDTVFWAGPWQREGSGRFAARRARLDLAKGTLADGDKASHSSARVPTGMSRTARTRSEKFTPRADQRLIHYTSRTPVADTGGTQGAWWLACSVFAEKRATPSELYSFMLHAILTFLLEVVVTLVAGACLLRMAMRWQRMPLAHPVGQMVRALSDWLVLPLQRVVRTSARLDVASLLGAWLLKLLQFATMMALFGVNRWAALPLLALLDVGKLAVTFAMVIIIIAVVLSWMRTRHPVADVLRLLAEPMLAPFRRLLPPIGGIDLSPLLVLVALQIANIVLASLEASLLGAGTSFRWS